MTGDYREMEKILGALEKRERLLLHSCCAPCSTHAIKLLKQYFDLTVFYFNPNIFPDAEYEKRLGEQKKLCALWKIPVAEGEYVPARFYEAVKGMEKEKEGGARCEACCALRLEETAKRAKEGGFGYFGTTLTVSPLKNAEAINRAGRALEEKYGVKYLVADLKKKDGYLDSVRTSKELGLYRQHYCGCAFSLPEEERKTFAAAPYEGRKP